MCRVYILDEAAKRGLKNISAETADMNTFKAESKYDRIISVEMFEHMKNYGVSCCASSMLHSGHLGCGHSPGLCMPRQASQQCCACTAICRLLVSNAHLKLSQQRLCNLNT
jgi:hypothetical protein